MPWSAAPIGQLATGRAYTMKTERSMRIWKWPLIVADLQSVALPEGAKLLSLQAQGDMPQLWALVDERAAIEHRTFATYGTGNPIPSDPGAYVGTYQIRGGTLVFHVFETNDPMAE
jgi:hypothetical protein